ncbi:DUF4258 domain-containing protein [candidate division KSB1 bacterium]|nr:DUF4258 domain-containing protein [candidate division KSB1 bacterium]
MKKTIIFSRPAKRRMKLYDISEEDVIKLLDLAENVEETSVTHIMPGYKYPIKVVFKEENGDIIVVTAYPLKRGRNEDFV